MHKPISGKAKKLTVEQTAELKRNAYGVLAAARKTILDRYPFFGSVAMSLELVPTRDKRIQTAANDGGHVYFDIDFLSTLSNDDKVFILAHEVLHSIMLHSLRKDQRDHQTFNYATDMEVNNMLEDEGLAVPSHAVTAAKYGFEHGLNAEAYYDLLVNRKDSGADGQPNSVGDNAEGSQQSTDGQFDKHIYKDEKVEDCNDDGAVQDRYGELGEDEDYQPNVSQAACERIREAAVAAAQNIERQGGTMSTGIKKIINDLLEPKLDWKRLLADFVTKCNGDKRTWNRCNRRFISSRTYLPASQSDKLKILVGIDTSGSVSSCLSRFLGELNGLVSQFEYDMTVVQCDCKIKDVKHYDNNEPLDLEHDKFEIHGYGGTDMNPILRYAEENQLDVDVCCILTDGHFCCEVEDPGYPVLWCVTKDGNKKMMTFGSIAEMN